MLPKSTNQVKLCARQFSADPNSEFNPDNAVDILLLADRNYLYQLKQVCMCVCLCNCVGGCVNVLLFMLVFVYVSMCELIE